MLPPKTLNAALYLIPVPRLDSLEDHTISLLLRQLSRSLPRASSTCPDLSVPSGSVKETISLYLGNLTWAKDLVTIASACLMTVHYQE